MRAKAEGNSAAGELAESAALVAKPLNDRIRLLTDEAVELTGKLAVTERERDVIITRAITALEDVQSTVDLALTELHSMKKE